MSPFPRSLLLSVLFSSLALSAAQASTAVAVSPTTGAYGLGVNMPNREMAARLALSNCRKKLAATDCQIVHTSLNAGFGALAMSETGTTFVASVESSQNEAQRKSSEGCEKEARSKCRLVTRWQENEPPVQAKSFLSDARRLLQKARDLQKEGHDEAAFQKILALAQQGIPEAQFQAGLAYQQGEGTAQDTAQAQNWLQQAAEQMEEGATVALRSLQQEAASAARTSASPAFRSKSINPGGPISDAAVDALVRGMPEMASHQEVGAWIAAQGLGEKQTARAVFVWLTDNIRYDTEAYFNNRRTYYDAPNIFRTRQTVCEGYANMFNAIGKAAGVKSVKVSGYSKGYGYSPGQALGPNDGHAWNAVWYENAWHLMDATWAAGSVSEEGQFKKEFDPFWFNTDPRFFVYSHLPAKAEWQLLSEPVAKSSFQQMPYVSGYYIANALRLGGDPELVLAALQKGDLISAWAVDGLDVRMLQAPLAGTLRLGESYRFTLSTAKPEEGAVIIDHDFVLQSPHGNAHDFVIRPRTGRELSISFKNNQGSYSPLLSYRLE